MLAKKETVLKQGLYFSYCLLQPTKIIPTHIR